MGSSHFHINTVTLLESVNNQSLTCCSASLSPSRFYGGALILLCLLYVVPVGWVLAGLNSAIFFWNRDFTRG